MFWTCFGNVVDMFWTFFEHFFDKFWTFSDHFWYILGACFKTFLGHFWPFFWSFFGSFFDTILTLQNIRFLWGFWQKMNQKNDQKNDQKNGQKSPQNVPKFRLIFFYRQKLKVPLGWRWASNCCSSHSILSSPQIISFNSLGDRVHKLWIGIMSLKPNIL